MFERFVKQKPFSGFGGFGGGGLGLGAGVSPFIASGGTKTGPTSGYFYHEYSTAGSGTPFEVTQGKTDIEVLLIGGGAGGGRGQGWGGGGGGGGAVGVWSVPIGTGTYDLTVGGDSGGDGNYTRLGPSSSYIQSGGGYEGKDGHPPSDPRNGQGGPGGVNSVNSWSGYSLPGDYSGSNGATRGGQDDGGPGGASGGGPQSPTLWWRPYRNPGSGGSSGGSAGTPDGSPGNLYGGGGKGTYSSGGSQGNGRQGRVIIRYPDSV